MNISECYGDVVFVISVNYMVIMYRVFSLCYVFYFVFMCMFYIVIKWEESI